MSMHIMLLMSMHIMLRPVRSRLVDAHQPCCARLVLDWLL